MSLTVDLAAERARAAERRKACRLRTRARIILAERWNATENELRNAIAEEYPRMEASEAAELLRVALEIQEREKPRRVPVSGVVDLRPPEVPAKMPPRKKYRQEWDQLLSERLRDREPDPKPESKPKPPKEKPMPAPKVSRRRVGDEVDMRAINADLRARITAAIDAEVQRNPDAKSTDIRRAVREATGIALTARQSDYLRAKARGQVKGLAPRRTDEPKQAGDVMPAATAAKKTDLPEVGSGDYIRLEEVDGGWLVQVSIRFKDAGSARKAIAGLLA
ncbi:MAG TPA: hypothetical protein VF167_03625 [Longimicrobiaceae bacterium]